jgi:hypothetical protein
MLKDNSFLGKIKRNKLSTAAIACLAIGALLIFGYISGITGTSIGPLLIGLLLLGIGVTLFSWISKYLFKIPKVGALGLSKYEIFNYQQNNEPSSKIQHFTGESFLGALINGESKRDSNGDPIQGEYVFVGLKQFFSLSEKAQHNQLSKEESDAKNISKNLLQKIYEIVNSTQNESDRQKALETFLRPLIKKYIKDKLQYSHEKNRFVAYSEILEEGGRDDDGNYSEVVVERIAKSLLSYIERRPLEQNEPDSQNPNAFSPSGMSWKVLGPEDFGLDSELDSKEEKKSYLFDYMNEDTKKMDAEFGFRNSLKYGIIGAALGGIGGNILLMLCGEKINKFYGITEIAKDITYLPALLTIGLGVIIGAALLICASMLYSNKKNMEVPKSMEFQDSSELKKNSMSLENEEKNNSNNLKTGNETMSLGA